MVCVTLYYLSIIFQYINLVGIQIMMSGNKMLIYFLTQIVNTPIFTIQENHHRSISLKFHVQIFNQAYITCLLFKGTARVDILDRKDFSGGIVADIEDSLRFIERNTRTAYRIEKLQRENIPEYPVKALREAITNAVMHRDWFIEGANVFVEKGRILQTIIAKEFSGHEG